MARVLLINSNRFKQPWPVIPFGLCCVAVSLEEAGHEVSLLDLLFSKDCEKEMRKRIEDFRPDIVGIGIRNIDNGAAYHPVFFLDQVRDEVILPCKRLFSGPIIIGGPAAGISGKEILGFFDLEYAIPGDGEASMTEFARRCEKKEPLEETPGLLIRRNGKIIQESAPYIIEDLNLLPLASPHKYLNLRPYRRFDSPLQVQTKRGCALKYSYCTYNQIEGHHYRFRNPELVAQEIEELLKETGINRIEFTDSTFNIPLDHAKAVLRALIRKGLNLRLRTMGLNPGAVDEELVDLMKKAGFTDVDLGVDSGSNVTLKTLGKDYTKEDVLRSARLLHEGGIPITWYLILGAPGETRETISETLDTVNRVASKWDLINFAIGIRVYKGSPMAQQMKREEVGCADEDFLRPVIFKPQGISIDTVKRLVKREGLKNPNFYMYDEDETTPMFLIRLGTLLLRIFAPRQPIWKAWILLRRSETLFGIRKLKFLLWSMRHSQMGRQIVDPEAMESFEEAAAYDKELEIYYPWMVRPQVKQVVKLIQNKEDVSILDLGCGTSKIPIGILKERHSCKICGLDISSNALKVAAKNIREKAVEDKISLLRANAKLLPFKDNAFDMVICSEMIHHQKDPVFLLKEMKRVVKSKGTIVIRDLIRPLSKIILNLYVGVFGLPYNKLMKKEYRESLYSAFTINEYKEMLACAGIKKAKITVDFPHFVSIIKEDN